MKNKIFTLLLVLFAFIGEAQNTGFYWNNLKGSSNRLQGKLTGQVYYLNAAEGKYHFFHKEWYEGSIVLNDGDVFENMRLRYMSYSDKLIAYNEAIRALFVVDKDIIDTFYIDSDKLKQKFVRLYFDGFNAENRYFEELYSGTQSLLVFHTIKEKKTRPYKNELGLLSDVEFEPDRDYYLYSKSKGFKRLRKNRQSLYSIFPEQKKEIRKILRKNRISLRNEWALIQAVSELDRAGLLN